MSGVKTICGQARRRLLQLSQKGKWLSQREQFVEKAALLAVLGAGVFAAAAIAQEFLLRSTIIGSNPNTVIGGVKAVGHPGQLNAVQSFWMKTEGSEWRSTI
jgi:hypothetical protein